MNDLNQPKMNMRHENKNLNSYLFESGVCPGDFRGVQLTHRTNGYSFFKRTLIQQSLAEQVVAVERREAALPLPVPSTSLGTH